MLIPSLVETCLRGSHCWKAQKLTGPRPWECPGPALTGQGSREASTGPNFGWGANQFNSKCQAYFQESIDELVQVKIPNLLSQQHEELFKIKRQIIRRCLGPAMSQTGTRDLSYWPHSAIYSNNYGNRPRLLGLGHLRKVKQLGSSEMSDQMVCKDFFSVRIKGIEVYSYS